MPHSRRVGSRLGRQSVETLLDQGAPNCVPSHLSLELTVENRKQVGFTAPHRVGVGPNTEN